LRLSLPTVGRTSVPAYGSLLKGRIDLVREALSGPLVEARRIASAYGPVWLAAPFALRDLPFARRGLVLVFLCLVAMTFALDWGRVILLAAPVFYVAAAHVVDKRRGLALALVLAFFALDLGYAA
jgi:hypothetical protein